MINKLINPFYYIAGTKALLWGLLVIVLTAIVGYYTHVHFPDVISVKVFGGYSFLYSLVQGIMNWLVLATLLYLSALLFSNSSVRAIDIYGTQALARAPYLLAAFTGLGGMIDRFGKYMLWTLMNYGEPVDITAVEIVAAVLLMLITLFLTVWTVTLMVNAFKVSANVKGGKLAAIFIVVLIISIVITMWLNGIIYQKLDVV